ncbi:MAG: hypothetical protein ACTSQF_14430, partial [Candidatus Heimdallarchaeaceae archaeon]
MAKKVIVFMFITVFLVSSSLRSTVNVQKITAEDSFEPWHFIALGDSRNWDENITNPVRKAVLEDVMLSNPNLEFILHTGDMA